MEVHPQKIRLDRDSVFLGKRHPLSDRNHLGSQYPQRLPLIMEWEDGRWKMEDGICDFRCTC